MTLDLIVTHYKEPWETCKYLFDSIALQRGIPFEKLKVIVINDGAEDVIPENVKYPFAIDSYTIEHGGVSAARNAGLMKSQADYVMFCDCDDMFLNNYGLHLVWSAMQEGFDALISAFVEEQKDGESWKIIRHDKDITFIHGKVYNRQYLIKNKLFFKNELTVHEDGYFNCLAHTCADVVKRIETPFYLWKWNENSTVRTNPKAFVLRTYPQLMDVRIAICRELFKRGYIDQGFDAVCKTVMDSYYDFNKPDYLDPKNAELVKSAEKAFKKFYMKFGDKYKECNITRVAEASMIARMNAYNNGMHLEQRTVNEWLNHIAHEVTI